MAHDLVTELLQYSSLACFMPIWQLCANLLIPNCLRSNLSYSPLAALVLCVNSSTSKKNFFLFSCPHTLTIRLKRPVYRGFSGEGKCEGKLSPLTPSHQNPFEIPLVQSRHNQYQKKIKI